MENNLGLRFTAIFVVVGLCIFFLVLFDFNYGIDLRGGYTVSYGLTEEEGAPEDRATGQVDKVDSTIAVMKRRVDRLGLLQIKFIPEGSDRIKIQIPGADQAEADRIKSVLTQLGNLELRLVATEAELQRAGIDLAAEEARRKQMEETARERWEKGLASEWYEGPAGPAGDQFRWYYYEDESRKPLEPPSGRGAYVKQGDAFGIGGDQIASVYSTQDERGFTAVGFSIKAQARGAMSSLTRGNIGRNLAIILNGEINSAPVIEDELDTGGIIKGGPMGYERQEAEDLIATLRSGSLEFKPVLLSEDLIGPTLGEDAIRRGGLAMIVGLGAILVFMLVYYRLAGVIANIALGLTLLILLGTMLLFSATLTLPGIAGIVLTVGMAVDANILIFERIREERSKGKTLLQSVRNGYEQAFRAIFDSNVTTLATALILVVVGTEVIKGFGVTLAIGIASSMFSALFATKTIFLWLVQKGVLKDISMMRIIGEPKIEFLRYTRIATVVSVLLVVGGLAVFFSRGDDKYAIDFTGGEVVQVSLRAPIPIEEMKNRIAGISDPSGGPRYPDAEVVSILVPGEDRGTSSRFEISTKVEAEAADELKEDIRTALGDDLLPEGIPYIERLEGEDAPEGFGRGFRFGLILPADLDEASIRSHLERVHLDQQKLVIERQAERGDKLGEEWSAWQVLGRPTQPDLDPEQLSSEVRKAFDDVGFPEPIPKATTIGKIVAKDLKNKAILAIILSLIFMIYYIRIRFHEYRYGFAAALCLVHDVVITLGACVLFNAMGIVDVKISYAIIAVFLTIVGYSLNDTIVIFDRVRENLKRAKGSFADTINRSINQTLSRTILTSLTTLFVVLVLLAVNYRQKSELEGFAFALLVGILSGTYSTIYVASPVVVRIGKYVEARRRAAKPA